MNPLALDKALNAHNLLANQTDRFVWQILASDGTVLGEVLDDASDRRGLSIRHSKTPRANAPVIRAMINTYRIANR